MMGHRFGRVVLVAALLCLFMLALVACGGTASQSSTSGDGSAAAVESDASEASGQAQEDGSQPAANESASASTPANQGDSKGQASQADAPKQEEQAPSTIRISVSIQSSKAGDKSFGTVSRTVTLDPGATAYDALKATGVSVSGSGSYVTSINGLAEKSCGASSGWTYYVNGGFVSKPANKTKLANGDSVTWYFVLSQEDRL